jgi:hypothetical protein
LNILFLASRLNPDTTSCGLLACKLLSILESDLGLDIKVLTFDPELIFEKVDNVSRIKYLKRTRFIISKESFLTKTGEDILLFMRKYIPWVHNKLNAVASYLTGYNLYAHLEIKKWLTNINSILKDEKFDFVFCYGAGHDFYSHIAMTKLRVAIPWVANYHDPYPGSLFPPPYNSYTKVISSKQERAHNKILERATYLSFPCIRLQDWIIKDSETLSKKSFILPHAACELPNLQHLAGDHNVTLSKEKFSVLHTGTLLSARNPIHLIKSFIKFLDSDEKKRIQSELIFIGNVHPKIKEEFKVTLPNNIRIVTNRLSYTRCLELSFDATILLIIEAKSSISPFFPGKLADYLWLRKPILALSPEISTTRDMIGSEFCSSLENEDRILDLLNSFWIQWESNSLRVDHSVQLTHILPPAILEKFTLLSSKVISK